MTGQVLYGVNICYDTNGTADTFGESSRGLFTDIKSAINHLADIVREEYNLYGRNTDLDDIERDILGLGNVKDCITMNNGEIYATYTLVEFEVK